tara:strand:- start:72262 stop:72828 length:567 start_codon:yes stop_codon:yes gene_type:complete
MQEIKMKYTLVPIGVSTSALLFCTESGEIDIFVGNPTDIDIEAQALKHQNYNEDSNLLNTLRQGNYLLQSPAKKDAKYYDIEKIVQGERLTACTVRAVHESHGKLMPNTITFSIAPNLLTCSENYPKALHWVESRAKAFADILESEGMKPDGDFILNSFIQALNDKNTLAQFAEADRGKQTITENMLS